MRAACIEEHFPHSMARAVTRAAEERGLNHEERHAEVEYVVAHGVATTLEGERALIGCRHFIFEDEGVACTDEQARRIAAAARGRSGALSGHRRQAGRRAVDQRSAPPLEAA